MIEGLIGLAAACVVVFLCLFCYRLGIKDGRAIKENKPLEKAVSIPKAEKKDDDPNSFANQYNAMVNFNPKFTDTRGIE